MLINYYYYAYIIKVSYQLNITYLLSVSLKLISKKSVVTNR